jgi:hypothetical protein
MLQYLPPFETRWTQMCFSPCDSFIPLDGTYRIIAPGIVGSHEIELEAAPGDKVVLNVHARTLEQHRTAENLVIGSYVAGGVGLACEVGAFTVNTDPAQTALIVSGVGAAAVGLALVITSFVLGQPTGLSQSVSGSAPLPAQAAPAAAEGLAAPRFGALADGREVRGPALPTGTSVPLLRLAF